MGDGISILSHCTNRKCTHGLKWYALAHTKAPSDEGGVVIPRGASPELESFSDG